MRLGVCSWSLRPRSPGDLASRVGECGLDAVQLALDPIRRGEWNAAETRAALRDGGVMILSGMMGMKDEDYTTLDSIRRTGGVRPDATWTDNLDAARRNADIAADLGIAIVTFHAGFIPEDATDPQRLVMLDRLAVLHAIFDERDIGVALETGQEPAHVVARLLRDLDLDIGVNFDPANMILYGMGDPIESLSMLAGHVSQIHIKDATPSDTPDEWGREQPVGEGDVDWDSFFGVIAEHGLDVDLVIERESGKCRNADVIQAATLVRKHVGAAG